MSRNREELLRECNVKKVMSIGESIEKKETVIPELNNKVVE